MVTGSMQNNNYWESKMNNLYHLGNDIVEYEHSVINLIASDNAMPRSLSDNPIYSGNIIQEGLIGNRPFAGAKLHDEVEKIACDIACEVFKAEHANLQPHSCSQANQAAYHALLTPGDIVMSLDFRSGGHLTHGLKYNFSGRHFSFINYGVTKEGIIDYQEAEKIALEKRPKLIVCGSSSYPRLFDAQYLRRIADSVNAFLMFDLSHEAGLIAGGVIPNIVGIADVVTMSTDKTLRGPFGGIILCKKEFAESIDKAVHPGTQSSFPIRKITNTAQSLVLTQLADFKHYAQSVLINAKILERGFQSNFLFTYGTDKHYIVINVKDAFGLTGFEAENRLERIGVLTNRQSIPTDLSRRMSEANGLRIGTAWATSRGYDSSDFKEISKIINMVLSSSFQESKLLEIFNYIKVLINKERYNDAWLNN
ncbi:MAG: serine hydroxymethyltransferase [Saprospiraceae bacterium]|nr:serine hydroxymethyltransferase [Saprospiraceae bacterium]